jgi:hypothetical protein
MARGESSEPDGLARTEQSFDAQTYDRRFVDAFASETFYRTWKLLEFTLTAYGLEPMLPPTLGEDDMATATRNQVNLDALIPREDLATPAETAADIQGLKISELKPGLVYSWLRKPDFQRETANWSPEQVVGLIDTFANGNIIPAIILWQNGQRVFVVDGAHRLSALIAWAQDDYGAGKISAEFYENSIPEQQRTMHDVTRKLVAERVGSYNDHELAAQFQKSERPDILKRAASLGFKAIDIQWIKNADVQQARNAFFRINQGGTEIDATETRILRAKDSALAISSRAISRGGTGHSYWQKFKEPERKHIEQLGSEIHKLLFSPGLQLPIKTLDVPLAGFGYGAGVLPFSFDLISLINEIKVPDSTSRKKAIVDALADDNDGSETVEHIKKAKKAVELILSDTPPSLGLHPALYFYTSGGVFQPAALFNVLSWIAQLEQKKEIVRFLKVRGYFEQMMIDHPVLGKPATHKFGSGGRTRRRMVLLYDKMLDLLTADKTPETAWAEIVANPDFSFLATDDHEQKQLRGEGTVGKGFSGPAKSAAFLEHSLPGASKCALCKGLLHRNGIATDHKEDKSKGGSSAGANAQPVHPRCNSEKEHLT